MPDQTSTIRKRLCIAIEEAPLPLDEDERSQLLEDLSIRMWAVFEEYGIDPTSIAPRPGYRYAQVRDNCPLCGEHLDLLDVELDASNGAHASARCSDTDCGWTGTAVYRLIDLEGGVGDVHESAVLTGDITPSYYSY